MCIGDIGLDSVFLFVVLGFGVFTGGLNVQRGARTAPNGVPRGGLSDYPTYCPNPWEQKLPKSLEYGASLCRGKLQKSLEAHVVVVFGVVVEGAEGAARCVSTPNPPTKIVPTNIARLKLSGNFPMGLGIPPL